MNETQLMRLKKDIDDAKTRVAELKGHQSALLQQLKNEWGCGTVEEAEKKLKQMQEGVEELNKQITEGLTELEGKYERI